MDSLLRTVNSMTGKRRKNLLIRDSLQTHLNTSVIEIQSAHDSATGVVGNCDEATTLCAALEAIFLHGLKDSLLNRVTQALSSPDFDAMPQPSFWGPLLVLSHRQVIKRIQSLSQITTEVGCSRAWIRETLNDGTLSNYLCYIKRDNSALKPYYNHWAYVRDPDLVEAAQRMMESLDKVTFNLACNSSLLNSWSNIPLLLAGIWSPPMRSCPIVSAVDVAKTISSKQTDNENTDEVETASSISSVASSFNSSQSAFKNITSITEEKVLKFILANRSDVDVCETPSDSSANDKASSDVAQRSNDNAVTSVGREKAGRKETEQTASWSGGNAEGESADIASIPDTPVVSQSRDNKPGDNEVASDNDAAATIGNSLIGKLGWSTSSNECRSSSTSSVISESEAKVAHPAAAPGDGASYEALIESYQNGMQGTPPEVRELVKQYSRRKTTAGEEPKAKSSKSKLVINFDTQLCNIPREKGLDVQNYTCLDCSNSIGMTFSKAYVCSYSGYYYCANCIAEGQYIIPSRMIHNWDLKLYRISRKAAEFLEASSTIVDLKATNPKIYTTVDVMAQLHSLRIQLNLLRAYLFTCREPVIESLQQKVDSRKYLYEYIHQYSISDLLDIPNGILAQQLQKVVEFARDHVLNCWLCKQKGFICEVCDNPKAIYPFDLESTFQCGECGAVFHATCLNASKPCPRCVRKRNQTDLPLLDISCTNLHSNNVSSSPERIETN